MDNTIIFVAFDLSVAVDDKNFKNDLNFRNSILYTEGYTDGCKNTGYKSFVLGQIITVPVA